MSFVNSNLESHETTVNGELTIVFERPSRHIELTNDSDTVNLQFKYKEGQEMATLCPGETRSSPVWVKQIILESTGSCKFRLWVSG